MKWILSLVIVISLYFWFKEAPIVVTYNYNGLYSLLVFESLNRWNVANIYFKPTSKGVLQITHNPPSDFSNPIWGGEYKKFHILLNERYQFRIEDFKGLVMHEAGHFIGLSHNPDPFSAMNHDSPYDTPLSKQDIENAKNRKWFLWLKLL